MKHSLVYALVLVAPMSGCDTFGPTDLLNWNEKARAAVIYSYDYTLGQRLDRVSGGTDSYVSYRPDFVAEKRPDMIGSDLTFGYSAAFVPATVPVFTIDATGLVTLSAAPIPQIINIEEIRSAMQSNLSD